MEAQHLVVTSDLDDLTRVVEFVRRACLAAGLSDDAIFACELATDEAFTNIIEHAYHGRQDGEIRVSCRPALGQFFIELHDHGTAFDPTKVETPPLTGALTERQIGGLGLHFIRSMMDEVHFEFSPTNGNTLTMVKRVPAS